MRICLVFLALGCCHAQTISAVLNAASYSNNLAPGTWAAIFGSNLAASPATAQSVPLPNNLGGVSVTVGGISAPLLYVSPGQVNALIPFELPAIATGVTATQPLVLTTAAGSVTQQITLHRNAPGIFTMNGSGQGNAIVMDDQFHLVSAIGTGVSIFYATGLGPLVTPVASGAGATAADKIADSIDVELGYQPATVQYAGLAPGFPGVYQINVVPNSPFTNSLQIVANGQSSSAVTVPMVMGANVSNATGTITGLYPSTTAPQPTDGPVGQSELLIAGSLTVDLQIKPGAAPFDIVAITLPATASGTVHIDPGQGTWQATMSTVAQPTSFGDFSALLSAGTPVLDLYTCQALGGSPVCNPFPGSIVPQSRMDPLWYQAAQALPVPSTVPPAGSVNGYFAESGALPADGHFEITAPTLAQPNEPANFGAYRNLGATAAESYTVSFYLFADGLQLDSKTVTAPIY